MKRRLVGSNSLVPEGAGDLPQPQVARVTAASPTAIALVIRFLARPPRASRRLAPSPEWVMAIGEEDNAAQET
jgi:hypothetical protein